MIEVNSYSYEDILSADFPYDKESELAQYLRNNNKLNTLINNPYRSMVNRGEVVIATVDGVLAGVSIMMPSKMLINGEIVPVLSGAGLETLEKYRNTDIGADLMSYPIRIKENEHVLFAGISPEAYRIYKALRYVLIDTPLYESFESSKLLLQFCKIPESINNYVSFFTDLPFSLLKTYRKLLTFSLRRKFVVTPLKEVPQWVDKIVFKDKHKYAELHDQKWLQWTINYSFRAKTNDRQTFYAVYKGDKPIGFFCTNERQKDLRGGRFKNIVFGKVYEWGTIDEALLSEYDIFRLSFITFSKNVDIINYTSSAQSVLKKLWKFFFFRHGMVHIVYKNTQKRCKDTKDINNWRIRYGYCDTPFYA